MMNGLLIMMDSQRNKIMDVDTAEVNIIRTKYGGNESKMMWIMRARKMQEVRMDVQKLQNLLVGRNHQ
jgi:hypothetical protein